MCGGDLEGQAGILFIALINGVYVLPKIHFPNLHPRSETPVCEVVMNIYVPVWSDGIVILMALPVLRFYHGHTRP